MMDSRKVGAMIRLLALTLLLTTGVLGTHAMAEAAVKQFTFQLDWVAADEPAANALAGKLTRAGYKAEVKPIGTQWLVLYILLAASEKDAFAKSGTPDKVVGGAMSAISQVVWNLRFRCSEFAEADSDEAYNLVAKLKAAGVESIVSRDYTGKRWWVNIKYFDTEAEAIVAKAKIDGLGLGSTAIKRRIIRMLRRALPVR